MQALRGVDMEVMPGAITLLVGPSGCGKTTLISIIAGLLDPSEGSLHVLGNDLTALPAAGTRSISALAIWGSSSSSTTLLPVLTAAENACLPLLVARRSAANRALVAARAALARVGLEDRADSYPCATLRRTATARGHRPSTRAQAAAARL